MATCIKNTAGHSIIENWVNFGDGGANGFRFFVDNNEVLNIRCPMPWPSVINPSDISNAASLASRMDSAGLQIADLNTTTKTSIGYYVPATSHLPSGVFNYGACVTLMSSLFGIQFLVPNNDTNPSIYLRTWYNGNYGNWKKLTPTLVS